METTIWFLLFSHNITKRTQIVKLKENTFPNFEMLKTHIIKSSIIMDFDFLMNPINK